MTTRIGGHVLAHALVAQGITHAFAVPGESYLDVLDGLYDVRDRVHLTTCRFEAGAAHMAEAVGKISGRPAAAFVTRGPGACHAAIGVHVAMQDSTPHAAVRGPDPVRRDRPRELPGSRLPPDVPAARQVGDADRRGGADSRTRRARHRCRDHRAAGAGGDRALRGDAEARGGCAGHRPGGGRAPAPRSGGAGAAAHHAGGEPPAARDPWRAVECHGAGFAAGVPGREPGAGDGRVPPPVALRRHARQFCRRSRRWRRPGAGGTGTRGRSGARPRHAARRGGVAGLHAVRPGRRHADRACASRSLRDRPRVSPRPRHRLRSRRVRRGARGVAAGRGAVAGLDAQPARAAARQRGGARLSRRR